MQRDNIFIAIAGRIWALWGFCLFTGTLIIAMVFYVFCFAVKDPRRARWHRQVSRVWMGIYLPLVGCPLTIKGKEHFEKGKNYIVVCNHNSLMDVPVTTPFMPNANKTIAKKEFKSLPLFGWVYAIGSILVDRNDEQSRKQSYVQMKQVLGIGLDMVIYPEGTRNRSGEPLKPFHEGAFRLSTDTGVPVLPAVIFNTKKVLPPGKLFFMLPHVLEMHFLPPQLPDGLAASVLKEHVFEAMKTYYAANDAG